MFVNVSTRYGTGKGGGGGFPELWPVKNLSSKESDIYFLLGLVNDIPKVILNLQ